MKVISVLNAIGSNVWAAFCLSLGCTLFAFREREGGLMLIGGGLTLLKTPHGEQENKQ